MANTLPHTGERPGLENAASRILVMGPQAQAIANALLRMKGNAQVRHAENLHNAIELLEADTFDHVLVDNRADGTLTLSIPRLAQLDTINRLTVLAGPNSAESIAAIPGIGQVITPPYNPIEIANSLGIDVVDSRKTERDGDNLGRRETDFEETQKARPDIDQPIEQNYNQEAVITDERHPVIKVISALVNFIPGLTPVLSALYKNTALVLLAGLFVAFLSYGVMIAYFLTSGDWSSPMQLQPGHELVAKAEREINELRVKRNLVSQQLSTAKNQAIESKEALLRGKSLTENTINVIDQEIANNTKRFSELKNEIETLEQVLNSFGSKKSRKSDRAAILRDYKNRIITRNVYQSAILNHAQISRQIAALKEQLTTKKSLFANIDVSIAYLKSLKDQLLGKSSYIKGIGGAIYVPLVNQVMEARQIKSSASAKIQAAEQAIPALENSLNLLTKSVDELKKTPMIRALDKPVTVLFVPYDNIDAYDKDQPLYSCALAIFWCTKVGETGDPISGEISTTHPFFGKPLRGTFVEAHLTNNAAAKKEILHVGRPPFFF